MPQRPNDDLEVLEQIIRERTLYQFDTKTTNQLRNYRAMLKAERARQGYKHNNLNRLRSMISKFLGPFGG